jgi:hypothetical protein
MSLPRLLALPAAVAVLAPVIAAVALPSPTLAATTPTPSPIASWRLDDKTGPIQDAVAARTGMLVGSPVLGTPTARSDDRGAAMTLTGSSAVSIANVPAFGANVTLEAWVNPQAGGSGYRFILSRGTTSSSGLHLVLDPTGRLTFGVGTAAPAHLTGPVVPAGTWHHVVATVAGRDTALYLDGKAVATGTLTAPPATPTGTLYLGRYSVAQGYYWRGGLDEVSIYDGALDAPVVAARYAAVADTTPPAVSLTAAPPAESSRTDAKLTFAATKTGSTFSCRLDDRAPAPCAGAVTYSGLTEGTHTASVLATDRYGIAAAAPLTTRWHVDRTAPDTLLLAARPTSGGAGEVSFVSEAAAAFQCQVDGAPWAACTAPFSAAAGATVAVRAIDAAGNADATPATAQLAPEAGGSAYAGASASFVVSGQRSSSALQCRLNSGAWGACPDSLTFTDLPYGTNALAVRDPELPGVTDAASIAWNAPLPVPNLIDARFPLIVKFASRRAQRRTKPSRAPRLLYRANTDGTAAVVLRKGRRTIATWTSAFHRGSNTMVFPIARLRRLKAGRHVITLTPRNAAGSGRALTRRFDVVRMHSSKKDR